MDGDTSDPDEKAGEMKRRSLRQITGVGVSVCTDSVFMHRDKIG